MRKLFLLPIIFALFHPAFALAGPEVQSWEQISPSSNYSQEDFVRWEITFSEDVQSFTSDDIEAPGWQKDLQGSGSSWQLDLWGGPDGQIAAEIKEGSLLGASEDPGPSTTGRISPAVTIDRTAPTGGGFSLSGFQSRRPALHWQNPTPIMGSNWVSAISRGSTSLALSSSGRLAIENDGWSFTNLPAGTWRALSASPTQWAALSSTGSFLLSNNGTSWSAGASLPAGTWVDLIYADGSFWALSQNGSVRRLESGSWNSQGSLGGSSWQGLEAQGKRLMAFSSASAALLFRGSWSSAALPVSDTWKSAASPKEWILLGSQGEVLRSDDGATWTSTLSQQPGGTGEDVVWWRGQFYLLLSGSSDEVKYSTDATSWQSTSLSSPWQKIFTGNRSFSLLGEDKYTVSYQRVYDTSVDLAGTQDFLDNDPVLSTELKRQVSTIASSRCTNDWSAAEDVVPGQTFVPDRCYRYTQTATDRAGNSAIEQLVLDTSVPPEVSELSRITAPSQTRINEQTLQYKVVFSKAVAASTLLPSSFDILGTASAPWSVDEISNPSGNQKNWLVQISADNPVEGTLLLQLNGGSVEDLFGTVGPPENTTSAESIIDLTPPDSPRWDGPDPETIFGSSSVSFAFSSPANFPPEENGNLLCALDDAAPSSCSSPKTWSGLLHGSYMASFWQEDEAGNRSLPLVHEFQVDLVSPSPPQILSGPTQGSFLSSGEITFTWSAEGQAFCRWNDEAEFPCSSSTSKTLPDGQHRFQVRAKDDAGNFSSSTSRIWTVDTIAPAAPNWTSTPPAQSGSGEAVFYWSGETWATYQCQLSSSAWEACSSPRFLSGLLSGNYVFRVRAIDRAGNVSSPREWSWQVIRNAPPQPTWLEKPEAASSVRSPQFRFESTATDQFQCSLDASAWESCSSPKTIGPLSDGAHSFRVRQINAVGTAGLPASWSWTVDTVSPERPTLTSGPPTWSNASQASFAWGSETGTTSQCSLDDAAWQTCSSIYQLDSLGAGARVLKIRSRDAAGNLSEESLWSWTVDFTAPNAPTILSAPPRRTSLLENTFTWQAEEGAQSQCSLDSAPWDICVSPLRLEFVSSGEHNLRIRQKDRAGNFSSPVSRTWIIDLSAPPPPEILDRPKVWSKERRVSFSWLPPSGTTSQCSFDGKSWKLCRSPWEYSPKEGANKLYLRALNEAGTPSSARKISWNTDLTAPVLRSWSIRPAEKNSWRLEYRADDKNQLTRVAFRGGGKSATIPLKAALQMSWRPREMRISDRAGNWSRWRALG